MIDVLPGVEVTICVDKSVLKEYDGEVEAEPVELGQFRAEKTSLNTSRSIPRATSKST